MAKQRDPVLDSMRGIGIVLMVLGHAGFPGSGFIYLFHMALFFMLSGWFFSPHTGESAHRLARFAKRKVVTLWLPFVAANTVYTQPVFKSKHPDRGRAYPRSARQPCHHAGDHQGHYRPHSPLERF